MSLAKSVSDVTIFAMVLIMLWSIAEGKLSDQSSILPNHLTLHRFLYPPIEHSEKCL